MSDGPLTLTFEESIRRRPAMYIGNDGFLGLIKGLILDCIALCKTDDIAFEITIIDDNKCCLRFESQHDLNPFWESFSDSEHTNYFPKALKAISKSFDITSKGEVYFSPDTSVLTCWIIDYLCLLDNMLQIALLNRRSEIVTIDKRKKLLNQNYFHYPQGIFYLFELMTAKVLGRPEFKILFDGTINGNAYQIGLAYRTDWYPMPNIASFANNNQTIYGGSLVDGVLDELLSACKSRVAKKGLESFKVNRKKLNNGLILYCAVRGNNFEYGGSTQEKLEDDKVRKEIKRLIADLALDFFNTQKEKGDKFLRRFDNSQLTSRMF